MSSILPHIKVFEATYLYGCYIRLPISVASFFWLNLFVRECVHIQILFISFWMIAKTCMVKSAYSPFFSSREKRDARFWHAPKKNLYFIHFFFLSHAKWTVYYACNGWAFAKKKTIAKMLVEWNFPHSQYACLCMSIFFVFFLFSLYYIEIISKLLCRTFLSYFRLILTKTTQQQP